MRTMVPAPPAPGRDMTPGELTHALQSLFNQSEADKNWFANLRGVIEHHAVKIDAIEQSQFTLEEEQATLNSYLTGAPAIRSGRAIGPAVESSCCSE